MTKASKFILALILILATFLRLYQLDTLPISLFGDEIDVGYQSWSLISTGKDYMGNTLPFYIQSLTEWRAPLLMYVTAPFIGIFGPTPYAVRLPAALLGVLSIYLLYQFLSKIFSNKTIGLVAAFLLAITPWHIHYSRAAFEVTLLMTLLLAGTNLFINGKIYLSLIPFVLTLYTYSTANIFTPLLILSLYLIYRPKISMTKDWYKLLPGFILALPIAYFILLGPASGRFSGISIFNDQKEVDNLIISRTEPWVLGSGMEKYFHNKPIMYLTTYFRNYTSALSGEFLFLNGDPNFRHSISHVGELPLFFAPFLLAGIVFAFINISQKGNKLILLWLFLSPIASSLTQGGGSHATRLFIMLTPLISLSAYGITQISDMLKKTKLRQVFAIILLIISFYSLIIYWHSYSAHYRFQSFKHWHYGYEKIFTDLSKIQAKGTVFINNTYEPSLLKYVFFAKYPPKSFIEIFSNDRTVTDLLPGFSGYKFADNVYFGQLNSGYSLEQLMQPGDLYVAAQKIEIPGDWDWSADTPNGFQVKSVVKDPFSTPLFYVIERE